MRYAANAKNFSHQRLLAALPLISSVFGYIAGVLIFILFGQISSMPSPRLISAFSAAEPLSSLIFLYLNEIRYMLLIFLCGFCRYTVPTSAAVLIFRAVGSGFSATYSACLCSSRIAFAVHTLTSALALIVTAFMCQRAMFFSKMILWQGKATPASLLIYALEFVFFSGLLIAVILLRHILLLFT